MRMSVCKIQRGVQLNSAQCSKMRLAILISVYVYVYAIGALQFALGQITKFSTLKNCLFQKRTNLQSSRIENLISRDTLPAAGTSTYAELNFQWNKCCGVKKPLAYLLAQSVADVQAAIQCSKQVPNLRVVPKGGGHSYGKYSFGDSETLVIDLQNMTQIVVNQAEKTATIAPGALMGQIAWTLYNNGKHGLPYGACPTVGLGFVLGGGYGEFSRLHGMAVDKLCEVDMIDANGNLLTANAQQNADLFWALRGGGAGSFGIVTRFKFELFKAPEQIVQGVVSYSFEDFPHVLAAWQAYFAANPPQRFNALLRVLPAPTNIIVLKFFEIQNQVGKSSTAAVRNILAEQFPPGFQPVQVETLSFLDYIVRAGNEETGFNINITAPSQLPTLGRHSFAPTGTLRAKTFYVAKTVTNRQVQELYSILQQRPPDILIILRGLGGAISQVSRTATAFVHRAPNMYEVDALFIGPEKETPFALPWLNSFFNKTQLIFNHQESYQNHLDVDLPDYLERYYGVNLARLLEVKRKYDPGNYFRNPQSVPPPPPKLRSDSQQIYRQQPVAPYLV